MHELSNVRLGFILDGGACIVEMIERWNGEGEAHQGGTQDVSQIALEAGRSDRARSRGFARRMGEALRQLCSNFDRLSDSPVKYWQ